MRRQRIRNREARDNKLAGLICSTCGSLNPIAWKIYRTCMSCWQKSNVDKRFRKTRDRQDCWYCSIPFEKQSQPGTVRDNERQWHKGLKEWICKNCFNHCDKQGSFGVRIIDIQEYEIRCEDCHTLYAWRWTTLGKKSLDRIEDSNITWDHIMCGNCYQKRNTGLLRNQKSGTSEILVFENKRDRARKEKDLTWQEYKSKNLQENGTYRETKLLVAYFLRVHEWDFGADQIIAEKMEKDKLELEEGLMDVD
ncbi:unnamed protein product [Penicillium nalgiovense]|uniref:Zinc-binding domain-containing protein n=2 Tax=Penicillium nalgiovense TaxID=60175 RepID=A0A9W4MW12_PENNA|nr:unnamed protein product [Penicillium nalgiovense]CAG8065686.1 unnamed protein product [Penicillium nalgiovense]CAG8083253.1 unnamed protein product [Penicillium nalgiovense]CAG8146723.1 unnamed protein product [Penicillium nalgiovense]CAG8155387.1 unnamed protein product [Penicillium nalgiovense]